MENYINNKKKDLYIFIYLQEMGTEPEENTNNFRDSKEKEVDV